MSDARRLSPNYLYDGRQDPPPAPAELRAGPLSLLFDQGDLRAIRLGDREILRRVAGVIRDRNWGTVAPSLSNLRLEQEANAFRIEYDCLNQEGPLRFAWHATIVGDSSGTVTFTMDGQAQTTFWTNRIGIVLLHPVRECAGRPYRATSTDGRVEQGQFPAPISPHQPVGDLAAIAHEVVPGLWASVRFTGDVFEMEDQRNWTDASYKTYSTPLARPYPVEVAAGARIAQTLTLSLEGTAPATPPESASPSVRVDSAAAATRLPPIGLGLASHGQPLSEREIARLAALHLAHLRADVQLAHATYPAQLRQAVAQATALGCGLEIALFVTDQADDELRSLAALVAETRPPVARWLVFHAAEKTSRLRWLQLARRHLAGAMPDVPIGGGTDAYFTELNRDRPPMAAMDLVCYSLNPQVHAFDNRSLVENLAGQAETVHSARAIAGDTPVVVSPVTLRPRFNPNATATEGPTTGLPPEVDVRQASLFGAGWTVGSLKYLAESGAASVTYYETTGWRGVMASESGSPMPSLFPSTPGAVFPLYHVLADAADFAGGSVVPTLASAPLNVDGITLAKGGRQRLLLANLQREQTLVRVAGLGTSVRVKYLDETTAEEAMRNPEGYRSVPGAELAADGDEIELTLRPYAVARIDGVSG